MGVLQQSIQGLNAGFERMRQAFNKNHASYAQAFGAADGHISVIRAVLNDMQRGEPQLDDDGNINWDTYYQWYNDHVAGEAAQAAKTNEASGSTLLSTQEATEEIFGGDYGGGL